MTHETSEIRIDSPLGPLRLLADARGLRGIYMQRHSGEPLASGVTDTPEHPILSMTATQLREYFAGDRRTFDLPLAAEGTEFQRRVWQALMTLAFGQTCSYGELARAIGQPSASRAVGAANGRNPLSIVVPCHRVIGADGSLTGYGGGEANKRWLLEHEARLSDPLFASTIEPPTRTR
jgi:methylated-DNA-[protein]-cysteine S-methyltransferase